MASQKTAHGMTGLLARGARYAGFGLLAIVLVLIAALLWFYTSAELRETQPAGRVGHTGTYASVEGEDIHYESWGPRNGPPILLIHGTIAWSGTWVDIGERLAARGFRVIAPDVPPFGFSTRPADRDYSRQAQAKLIIGFADALRLESFVLAGHSFGSGATVEAAFSIPQRIKGLILFDAALSLDDTRGVAWISKLFATPLVGQALTASTFTNPMMTGKGLRDFIADDSLATPERVTLYQQPLSVQGTSGAVADWLSTGLFADESASLAADPDNYRRFERPTILIWGRQDTVTPLSQGEHIRSLLPRSTLVVLDDVNHIPHLENPDAVAAAIAEFAGSLQDQATLLPQALIRRASKPGS
jgi:pimeloyl-ACP methyl ester carboxylesterase